MANFSNYAESGILNFLLRSNTNSFGAPLNISIALCSGIPSETNHGGNIPELANAGGYARVNLGAPSNSLFSEVSQTSDSGVTSNVSEIAFPTATADWGYVSGVAICTSGTYGAGQVLMMGAVTTPRDVRSGDVYRFSANQMIINLG